MVKRGSQPWISNSGQEILEHFHYALRQRDDLQPATVRNYLSDLRQFIAWCEASWQEGLIPEAEFRLPDLTTPLIAHYRAYLQATLRLKPASINRMLISIKRFCAWATERGMLASNPASSVKLVEQEATKQRYLTAEEERALLAAVASSRHTRDQAIIITLLHTGLRAGELCAVRFDQVHLGHGTGRIEIRDARQTAREIPLDEPAQEALKLYLPTRPTAAVPLFVAGKTGHPLTERTVGRIVHKYADLANLAPISPTDLRHRFGYRMAQTTPLPELARIMGHSSLTATLRYLHPQADEQPDQ